MASRIAPQPSVTQVVTALRKRLHSSNRPMRLTPRVAGFRSEYPAGFKLECMAGFVGTRIIQASRAQYHAGGRPCACPDDTMRNGRACGGRSAYSRPGGAAPLCYPHDVTAAMIESYRQRQAAR